MDSLKYDVDLVPAAWLEALRAPPRPVELRDAWNLSAFPASPVVTFIDGFAVREERKFQRLIRWGTESCFDISLWFTDRNSIQLLFARFNCQKINERGFHVVGELAETFELSAVTPEAIIHEVNAASLATDVRTSLPAALAAKGTRTTH